ncbi:MAG TPA: hypothetical protein VFX48_00620, partial [Saprospiraceae bacterium]|nr:hypothetical protein [Saprospiraceae bacterium]
GQFPEDLSHFPYRSNTKRIAWKTGTSFGFKDAWCVGVTPEYTMVVWVGNSNGVGRPGLIGLHTAAPLLFECFQKLTTTDLWPQPFDDMYRWVVCKESGYPLSLSCESADTVWHPAAPVNQNPCPYHERIWTDPQKTYRVVKDCEPDAVPQNWFVLPPVMEYYYKTNHPAYKSPPPVREDCRELLSGQKSQLEFIYPDRGAEIYVPVDLDDQKNTIVLKATHKSPGTTVHWFLDGSYLGATADGSHEWIIQPAPGRHALMIADDAGHSATAVLQCHGRER